VTPESIEERLATIEEHIRNIDITLANQVICRHVTRDGDCDFTETIIDHDRKINQWTGALAAVSLLCAMIGGVIGVMLAKVWK
jgi:hypothetical protein